MLARVVDDVLALGSRLSSAKVFDRSDVIVAVAPHLHGLPVSELSRVVDAVIADVRCVPLIGVVGARTQVYATAATLAAEEHIADLASSLAEQPSAAVGWEAAEEAVAATDATLGAEMTDGQRDAAFGILTSGAGLDLVVGVAGSGKSTMVGAVTRGFTACGYTVIGTATSGQAARGLGEEAGIGDSRTVASLCWRLEHDRTVLGPRHVLVLDEAGATDDPDFAKLLASVQRAKAKLVVVGDDRQLSPVGPGGALAAPVRRHPQRLFALKTNVRQRDPGERRALAELRAGKVDAAVEWYAAAGRAVAVPDRDAGVAAMVEAWAGDVAAGKDTLLLAWRRADVEAVNLAARAAYARLGRLSGLELCGPAGQRYRAGDRVLMLTPGPGGAWVTSERATVTAVHDDGLVAVTDAGRELRLGTGDLDAGRLTYAYAMTAHRSQGATTGTAHVLDAGGGRELAYVAMSRARERTHVYVAADGRSEAVEQLRFAWGGERRQHWALDQGQPDAPPPAVAHARPSAPTPAAPHLRPDERGRLLAERDQIEHQITTDVRRERVGLEADIAKLDASLAMLRAGEGMYGGHISGNAARAL
jgi:hypothetical protein